MTVSQRVISLRCYSLSSRISETFKKLEANLSEEHAPQPPTKVNKGYRQELRNQVMSKKEKWAVSKDEVNAKKTKPAPKFKRISSNSTKRSARRAKAAPSPWKALEVCRGSILVNDEQESAQKLEKQNIPELHHRLDRALFSPGVQWYQDPRTRIYNFPPYLKTIPKVETFNFNAIDSFQAPGKDPSLGEAAVRAKKQFYSSTSSMTQTLTHFYLFLNNYDPELEQRFEFPRLSKSLQKRPATVTVQYRPEFSKEKPVYSIDSDKSTSMTSLLSAMGHCLEAFLTTPPQEFADKFIVNDTEMPMEKEHSVYNYSTYSEFMMRSQLDCYDDRLPGNGTFDLKTRVAVPYRYNPTRHDQDSAYQVFKTEGDFESFQREYTDLIRTGGFLKYMFQARIGQMDGIFLAYHNLSQFFGFQYLPLEVLDEIFYNGSAQKRLPANESESLPSYMAQTQFKQSIKLWETILKQVIEDLPPKQSFRLSIRRQRVPHGKKPKNVLKIMAVPVTPEQITELNHFPRAYKTSYREKLSKEEFYLRRGQHERDLAEYNRNLVTPATMSQVHNYELEILASTLGERKYPGWFSVMPQSGDQPWTIDYKLSRVPHATTADDLESLKSQMVAEFTTPFFWRGLVGKMDAELKAFELIGKQREAAWRDKDREEIEYVPRE
ncbi:hypothetical protein DIURU_000797 [Diutina rugosa]|uniref:Pet127-domain-containing protein n=1 Tax=Diutina rugosa TaxID=5481 RepID=A0A642V1U2_DIURU|nr:uncharacterized protein DIURU_000797 [Diutina rugosa]KAA8907113.1 hypothetical protein DIURU_000797 [Diutina rugosa]